MKNILKKEAHDTILDIATGEMRTISNNKILGPKGLMPNPKSGTVTMNILKAIKELKAGKLDARVENIRRAMHR